MNQNPISTPDINWVDKQCNSVLWMTPEKLLGPVRTYFGGPIELDPANQPDNPTKALRFYTEEDDGLAQPWNAKKIFINPPFGDLLKPFLEKIHLVALNDPTIEILAVLPCGARFGTKYFQADAICGPLKAICWVKGRVKFSRPDGTIGKQPNYDTQIFGYNVDASKFVQTFAHLGKCLEVKTYD